jgi:hypothetical protein
MSCDAGAMTGPVRPDHADRGRAVARRAALPAGTGLVLAFPVATWWLVGDLSTVPASADPDFAFKPFDISTATARAAGVAAVALAAVTLTVLVCLTVRRVLDARWWSVLGPLLAAGLITGTGWRVMTAGIIGTNIGAGFVILFGSPAVAALLTWALARSIYLAQRRRHPPAPTRS